MRSKCCLILISVLAVTMAQANAQSRPVVKLWRLDCGSIQVDDLNDYSDTYAYAGRSKRLTASCYLIKHNDDYKLWDTGLPKSDLGLPLQGNGSEGETLSSSLIDQLAQLRVDPPISKSSGSATITTIILGKLMISTRRAYSWGIVMCRL